MNRSAPNRLGSPPPSFVEVVEPPACMWVRHGYEAAAPRLGLHGDPPADAWLGGGRAAHPVVSLPDGSRALVRRYLRGGLARHLNRATYFLGHRAFAELRATEHARAAGVRVPEVLAATERCAWPLGYAAWLATRLIDDVMPADEWLRAATPARHAAMLREAGRQIALLHAAGIAHPDLNLRNLLVRHPDPPGQADVPSVWIIDFDGVHLYAPGSAAPARARARNLRRLARSARKLGLPLGGADWVALREGYGPRWPARVGLG